MLLNTERHSVSEWEQANINNNTPVAQTVKHGGNNIKVVGLIPRECMN